MRLRSPTEVRFNRFNQGCQFCQEFINLFKTESVRQTMLRTFERVLILEEQWRSCQESKTVLYNYF